ncbi:MAG: hypothetical protein M0P58_08365 [Bacteroidales bacterium]|nr:hypothetical protein [Bacteroidales bacterium]
MKPILEHTSLDFKINEIKTLEYIYTRGFFEDTYTELHNAIYASYSRFCAPIFKSGKKTFDFSFVSDFDIEIEGRIHKIIIHAEVLGNYNFVSYSIGISHKDDSTELIRRFHFDYDHDKIRTNQKAFISHLQYGGNCGTGFSGTLFRTANIEPKLSVPRFNFPPMNLALLLDIVFCEFQNESTKKITENPDWRSLIKENEVFILKRYFNSISNHIGSPRHNKETLVRDICYA